MSIWTFRQPDSIPGVSGTFAGVTVEINDATHVVMGLAPLAVHADFVSAPQEIAKTPDPKEEEASEALSEETRP